MSTTQWATWVYGQMRACFSRRPPLSRDDLKRTATSVSAPLEAPITPERISTELKSEPLFRKRWFADVGFLFSVAALYYIGTKIGFMLTFKPHPVSTLWPTNAILMAMLLLAPSRKWGLVLMAALPAHLAAQLQSGVPTLMVSCWFVSNCTEALIGAGFMRYLMGYPMRFDSLARVTAFIGFAAFLAPLLSSFLDAGFVIFVGFGSDNYWQLFRTRFLSNVLATITFVPVITMVAAKRTSLWKKVTARRLVEAAVLTIGLIAAGIFAFSEDQLPVNVIATLVYVPLPFLLWAAVRFGPAGLSTALLATALMTVWGAIHGLGPFSQMIPVQDVFFLQVFLIVMSVPLMLLAGVIQDRKETGRALSENRERLKAIFDGSMDGILLADDRGHYVDANASACRLIQLSREQLVEKSIYDLVVVDPSVNLFDLWHEFLSKGRRVGSYALKCNDASLVHVECFGVANIQPGLHLFVIRDLSERRRAELALSQSEERYREVVESQTELVCRYRPDTTLTFVNGAYCRFFGKSRDELIGSSFLNLVQPAEREEIMKTVRSYVQDPRTLIMDHEIRAADGSMRWVQWTIYPTFNSSGAVVEFQAIGTNITERRRAEESLQISHQRITELAVRLVHAQEEERRHIARELHDDFNQRLAAHAIAVGNLEQHVPEGSRSLRARLDALRDEAIALGDEIRLISHNIHPPMLEREGLATALRILCEEFGALTSLKIDSWIDTDSQPVQPAIALCCYRVVQEGLRNVSKHAHASRVQVSLRQVGQKVVLVLADNGTGLDNGSGTLRPGLGIVGMEERVKLLRGEFHIGKRKDGGTIVMVELPVL